MTTSRFSDDNLGLVPPGSYEPKTVQTLLAYLHLEEAPRADQEKAILDWLKTHPPGQSMTFTLKAKGFGDLLNQRLSA